MPFKTDGNAEALDDTENHRAVAGVLGDLSCDQLRLPC